GGLDIFQAMYENGGFHKVTNLGQPINSSSDDFSYIVREETKEGYFASNRKGGKGDDDIYSFKLLVPEEATENLNAITGVISESLAGEVLPNALVVLLDENNKKLKQVVTNEDGSFVFEELESNTDYTIKIEQNQYFKEEIPIATLDNRVIETEIKLKKLKNMIVQDEGVKKLETEAIFFDFDQSSIRDDAAKELDKLVAVMNEYPSMVIKIESHTDALGSRQYNKFLSDKRAKSTKDYLISKGIDSDRIESAIGYGEEHLLNDCNDNNRCGKEKHRQNRRSEFIIVNM
ncbi:MAG: OmpA family protein, partial [Bacteroidota bacterium]